MELPQTTYRANYRVKELRTSGSAPRVFRQREVLVEQPLVDAEVLLQKHTEDDSRHVLCVVTGFQPLAHCPQRNVGSSLVWKT